MSLFCTAQQKYIHAYTWNGKFLFCDTLRFFVCLAIHGALRNTSMSFDTEYSYRLDHIFYFDRGDVR